MKNDSDRTQTDEVIEVIGSIFANVANLKGFNWGTLHEGALGSRRLFGINCRTHRALRYESEIVQIGHELMKLSRLSRSEFRLFAVSLIAQTSSEECSRKEPSDQDSYMDFRRNQGLHFKSKIMLVGYELMKLWRISDVHFAFSLIA